jgi:hypothetical protein
MVKIKGELGVETRPSMYSTKSQATTPTRNLCTETA